MTHAGTVVVSGLINLETTVRVDGFPVGYFPVRYAFDQVGSGVAGVGFNVAKALATLGSRVRMVSLLGDDGPGRLAREALAAAGLGDEDVLDGARATPQSVILYDPSGRRQIHVDLKNIQECIYPLGRFETALDGCDLAVLCNVNFSRPFLAAARRRGIRIATDVHVIGSLDDEYNRDFLAGADILFQSDERLPCPPEDWARAVMDRFGTGIVVVGLGAHGALLAVQATGFCERLPSVTTRPVVNTVGAGDALFASFVHFLRRDGDPVLALRRAQVFASWKIGESGAGAGFLSEEALLRLEKE